MDQAAFHVWSEGDGWRFGPSPENAVVEVSGREDVGDIDVRAAIAVDDWDNSFDWTSYRIEMGEAAVWPIALSDSEIQEASAAMVSNLDIAAEASRGYLALPDTPDFADAPDLPDHRPLPDDSRGILVSDMRTGDGPHVPTNMPTDQIPLPQDFDYPAPAIDLDNLEV